MHLKLLVVYLTAALPLVRAGYRVTTQDAECREGPSNSYKLVKKFAKDAYIDITCQVHGQNIDGYTLWDRTPNGCYVNDKYVWTGTDGMVAPTCSNSGGVQGYRITTPNAECREGPSNSYKLVKNFAKDAFIAITCQVHGQNIDGYTLWDRTPNGCYVNDKHVWTGTDGMIAPYCAGSSSEFDGPISRNEVMTRAEYWITKRVPYSMNAYYPDLKGAQYRTDCSGFVSMALHLSSSLNTVTLPNVARAIAWNQLLPGDFVGTLGAGTGGAAGHVTLFEKWLTDNKSRYQTLECMGGAGCVRFSRDINWPVGSFVSKPYRYIRVV